MLPKLLRMNIHEYQGKEILKRFGVAIQRGIVADTPDKAVIAAKELQAETGTKWFVVKSQIHAGGRGKGTINETGSRGVVLSKSLDEVFSKSKAILGGTLVTHQTGPAGKKVNKVLIAEDVYYPGAAEPKEYYMSILLDRATSKPVIMASLEGGVNIEEVAAATPEKIIKEWIDPALGVQPFQARKVAFGLGLEGNSFKEMVKFIHSLYAAYVGLDASMFEINPVLKTSDGKILAVDAKVNLDDNALFRHKDLRVEGHIRRRPAGSRSWQIGPQLCEVGWQRWLHGEWSRTCHGNYGHNQTLRRRTRQLPRRGWWSQCRNRRSRVQNYP